MFQSETIGELAQALVKAQAVIRPAIKDKTNPAFRSKYADLGAVWEACRALLADNGLSVVQMPEASEPGYVALTTLLLHVSGEFISSTATAPLVKNDPQGVGSALTYLRRYALAAVVGVVADEDDDGNAASNTQPRAAQSAPPQRQAAPATNGSGDKATDAQLRAIWAAGKAAGIDAEGLKAEMTRRFGIDKSGDLSRTQASELIDWIKSVTPETADELL